MTKIIDNFSKFVLLSFTFYWIPLVSCQYYAVKQYIPSSEVYYGHAIPPSQTFTTTYDYYYNILYLPVILLGIGILALLIYQTILCFKFFYHRYCPQRFEWCYNKKSAAEVDYHERMKFHRRAIYAFFISLALALIINCLVFISKTSLTTSVDQHLSSMNQLSTTFANINTQSDDLSTAINALKNTLATTNCRYAFEAGGIYDTMQTSLTSSDEQLQQVTSTVSVLPPKIDFEMDYVTTKVEPNMSLAIWLYWALVMFWVFFLTAIFFCRTKVVLTAAIVATEILIIVLAVISTIELALVHVTADGCMDPTYTVLTVFDYLKLPSDFTGLTSYYSTCNGTNPLISPYNEGLSALTSFNTTLNTYMPVAQLYIDTLYNGDQCLNTIKSNRNDLFTNLYTLYDAFAYCPTIYNIWYLGVNESVCTSGYKGLYIIWIIHILTLMMLYIALTSASFFYEMYYPTHAIDNNNNNDNNNDEVRGSVFSGGGKYDDGDYNDYESQQPLSPRPIEYEDINSGNNNNNNGFSSRIVVATKIIDDDEFNKTNMKKGGSGGSGAYEGYFKQYNEQDTQHTSPHHSTSVSVTSSPTRSPDKLMKHRIGGKGNNNNNNNNNSSSTNNIHASGKISYDTLYNNNDNNKEDDGVIELTENRMSMYSNNSANTASNRNNSVHGNTMISPRISNYNNNSNAGFRIKNNNTNSNSSSNNNNNHSDNIVITPRATSAAATTYSNTPSTKQAIRTSSIALTDKIAVAFPSSSLKDNTNSNKGDEDDDGSQNNSNHNNNNNTTTATSSSRIIITPRIPPPPSDVTPAQSARSMYSDNSNNID